MIFEAAADDSDAVRQQSRGDAVAGEADIRLAVEGEGEGPPAIDGAAGGQASAGQDAGLARASLRDDGVGRRVARHREHFHAGQMQPDLARLTFRIGVEPEIARPFGVADRAGRLRPRFRFADIVEFALVARAAERAGEDLHGA